MPAAPESPLLATYELNTGAYQWSVYARRAVTVRGRVGPASIAARGHRWSLVSVRFHWNTHDERDTVEVGIAG